MDFFSVSKSRGVDILAGVGALLIALASLLAHGLSDSMDGAAAPSGDLSSRSVGLLPTLRTHRTASDPWESQWQRVEAALRGDVMDGLREQLLGSVLPEGTLASAGIRPSADTWFMRHPEGLPQADGQWQRQFQAATVSNDPEYRLVILEDLAARSAGVFAYRVHLEVAQTYLRMGPERFADLAARALDRALAVTGVREEITEDAIFLRGYIALRKGATEEAIQHLIRAVTLDPYHFDARAILVRALLQRGLPSARRCREAILEVMEHVQWLGVLGEDRRQFADLAEALKGTPSRDVELRQFVIAFAALLGGERRLLDEAIAAMGDSAAANSDCRAPLRERAEWMRQAALQ